MRAKQKAPKDAFFQEIFLKKAKYSAHIQHFPNE